MFEFEFDNSRDGVDGTSTASAQQTSLLMIFTLPSSLPSQTVWVDPICGDGICEAPFEFASYSHFGCRADCGKLQNIQNLTTIQIDLYFDFTHPVGSIPASVREIQEIEDSLGI